MKIKNKNSSHINRPRPWHGHKYFKYKDCPSMMVLTCIKQHLYNIWCSVYKD